MGRSSVPTQEVQPAGPALDSLPPSQLGYDQNTPNNYLVNYDGSAAGGTADLLEAQWQNYIDNYSTYEDQAIEFATSDAPVAESLANVRSSIDRGFNTADKSYQQGLSGYGISETARQRQARTKKQDLRKGSSLTQGLNSARLYTQGLQDQILSGDLSLQTVEKQNLQG